MCIAIPARIEEILEGDAIVNYNGVNVKVNIGDYVLVHAGCAIQKIDENYARETLDIFKELSDAIEECNFNGHIKRVEK